MVNEQLDLDLIRLWHEFMTYDCSNDDCHCRKCRFFEQCGTMKSEDGIVYVEELLERLDLRDGIIRSLEEQLATMETLANFYKERMGMYIELIRELNKGLSESQELVDKQNGLLWKMRVICPEELR